MAHLRRLMINDKTLRLDLSSKKQDEIKKFLDSNNIAYVKLDRNSLLQNTAKLISEGNVIGWYQGKMEWGPRALGNRSILADPRRVDMKDILNEIINISSALNPFTNPDIFKVFYPSNTNPYVNSIYTGDDGKLDVRNIFSMYFYNFQ